MTLDVLLPGKDAVIDHIDCEETSLRRHILEMGLTPGTEVTMIKAAPLGDPLEIRTRGYELTLRKADAAKIALRDVHTAHKVVGNTHLSSVVPHPGVAENNLSREHELIAAGQPLKFALVGNQNCGKTTLFNQLTGANQHVGNFPGVTLDRKDGTIRNHPEATVTDLPGIYSLSPYSSEEIVTREFLFNDHPDGIINIVDATNIERNLYLTIQIIELNMPVVLALNMMDEVRVNGGTIDVNALERALGIPVVPISAAKNEGISELVEHAVYAARHGICPARPDFCDDGDSKSGAVHRCIHAVIHLIDDHARRMKIPTRFAATKLIEGDEPLLTRLQLDENEKEMLEHIVLQMEQECGQDRLAALADMRYRYITKLCSETVVHPAESRERQISKKIDRVLTGRYTALPAFIVIMALVFWLTFGCVGSFLSGLMERGIEALTLICDHGLIAYGINSVVHSLIIDGIFAGVGSVLSFLPTIVVLFFFLSMLEDSGYMARVAFVMDKLLRKIGLSGRSIVPMLIGFGCSVPAIMATRTLPSDRDRKMTILLTPFMSCSAKLPIYAFFTAAFFPKNGTLVMLCLYFGGIIAGILCALFMKSHVFRGEPVPFVMELPNYRMPTPRNVLQLLGEKAKDFITKAFTVIFIATVIIWFLQTFDTRLNVVENSSASLLALIGGILSPVFKPLGLGDWRCSTALITGFSAKESVVSTLEVLLAGSPLSSLFTTRTALSFLVFSLLYTPCVAAIAAVKRELGHKGAITCIVLQCAVAWTFSFIVYLIAGLI